MTEADAFRDAIRRIRAGDEQAAAELVEKYGPIIRREVRLNLVDTRLRRTFDSMDVVQSVLASFFVRTAVGDFELDSPKQLAGLLVRMARNKLASAARKNYRRCRDARRTMGDDDMRRAPSADLPPDEVLSSAELLDLVHARLSGEEREMADRRAEGCSWDDIARRMGGKPQARRMQLARAIERISKELGLATQDE